MLIIDCFECKDKKSALISLADFGNIQIHVEENQLREFCKLPYLIITLKGVFKVTEQNFVHLYFKEK